MTKLHRIRNEQGQTMTEFALVLPVLALLLFGVIQFGILFNNYVTLTKAAVSRQASDPRGDAEAAVRKAADTLDQTKLNVSVTPGTPWTHGGEVTVTATYPYKIDLLGFALANGDLKSTTVERVE